MTLNLLPTPKHLELLGGYFQSAASLIYLDANCCSALLPIGTALQRILSAPDRPMELTAARGTEPERLAVTIDIDPHASPVAESYSLTVSPSRISIVAHDPAGAYYAAMTLRQIARQIDDPAKIPCLRIVDAPDFPARGLMLDISRDKVPSMQTLFNLVDLLAEWKINQLQLYTEHTFAYRRHKQVWADASPMTGEQILRLDRYCRERHIELVPNQNSFGHMERWLSHAEYLPLAEAPEGFIDPWGNARGPYGLCPLDPRSIQLIEELYGELLPHFSSRNFNVGCDETFDLGKGKSKQACDERGAGRVYLDFLLKIYGLARRHNCTMQFWGDIILHHPELIGELPRDTVALEWGYEANHPFKEHSEAFAKAGIPYYVCPGTSTWNTIAGRTDNAIDNISNAAEIGKKSGAAGLLNTDWGDNGHWQHLPISYLGYAMGAAAGWNHAAARRMDIQSALNLHVFHDRTGVLGKVAFDLGNAYQTSGVLVPNNSILALLLCRAETPVEKARGMGLTVEGLKKTLDAIDAAIAPLSRATASDTAIRSTHCRTSYPGHTNEMDLLKSEFSNAAAMMRFACQFGIARLNEGKGTVEELPAGVRQELSVTLESIIADYEKLWIVRNRVGGLRESAGRLKRIHKMLTH